MASSQDFLPAAGGEEREHCREIRLGCLERAAEIQVQTDCAFSAREGDRKLRGREERSREEMEGRGGERGGGGGEGVNRLCLRRITSVQTRRLWRTLTEYK